MEAKEFGTQTITPRNYAAEMQKLVGANCPITITTNAAGELVGVSYVPEWKEGGTKPITKKGKVVDYKEDYTDHKLTKAQIKQLDKYIADNIKG